MAKTPREPLEGTETTDKYYYASGKKIPLSVSTRFVAVKASENSKDAPSAAAAVADRIRDAAAPVQVLRVPGHNIALLTLAAGSSPSSNGTKGLDALRRIVASEASIATGPTVYESPSAPVALVPVGEIIVKFRPNVSKDDRQNLLSKYGVDVRQENFPEPGALLVASRRDTDVVEAANRLEEEDQVEFAEPNFVHVSTRPAAFGAGTEMATYPVAVESAAAPAPAMQPVAEPQPMLVPTDPAFASQWNLQKIRAPLAWDITPGNPAISVAIIDEGCDIAHEDIGYKLPGYDAFAGDNDPTPNGNDAHGTACAGVAAMKMNNGKGGAGVAPGCQIVPIRIAQGIGGGFWSTDSAKVADGIRKAVDAPRSADVLSNSYSVGDSSVVTNAFQYARTNGRGGKGCPIAAAAGNSNAPPVIYPARLSATIPGMMAVSATNEWDQRKSTTSLDGETWWGSSFGPEVDIAAPGVHIYSPDITGAAGYSSGNYIPNFNGTSSATPHVAGMMALVLSVDPDLRSWEVEEIVKRTAVDLGPAGRDQEFGFGRIDCRRALEAASKISVALSVVPEFIGTGKECFMRINAQISNPGINTIRVDGLRVTSHNPTWTAEIDRFEYLPNPGNILAPYTTQDVKLNNILLKANGNQQSWSYRWAASWWYTYWRPAGPVLPLSPTDITKSAGARVEALAAQKGSKDGGTPTSVPSLHDTQKLSEVGDSLTVDRQTRSITIVIR